MLIRVLLTTALFFSFRAMADLPKAVIDLIAAQKLRFSEVLSQSDATQRKLTLERFADILFASPLRYDFDKAELVDFLDKSFPEQLSSPRKVRLSDFGELSVRQLVNGTAAKQRGDILDIPVQCEARAYTVPVHISDNREVLTFSVEGVGVPDFDEEVVESKCLQLNIYAKEDMARLSHIATKVAACPLPSEKAGNCLLRVAERIGKALGKKRLRVMDSSKFRCTNDRRMTNLRRLQIYKEGKGWYEKQDFVSSSPQYEGKVKRFLKYTIDALLKDVAKHSGESEQATLLKALSEEYLLVKPDDNKVAGFMKWLWDKDCENYNSLDDFLFRGEQRFKISRLYPQEDVFFKELTPAK